jgi:hypothetical protein
VIALRGEHASKESNSVFDTVESNCYDDKICAGVEI